MRKYVIMGIQGCGKGTQAKLLATDYDLVHISTGDILRWHGESKTKLGSKINRLLNQGYLVPDELIEELVRDRLEQHDWNYGFILDGFPRSVSQADFFNERYDVDAVIHIHAPDEVVIERMLARKRPDDTLNAIRERMKEYRSKTEPVLDVFRRKETVITVDGTPKPEVVQEDIRRQLGLTFGSNR